MKNSLLIFLFLLLSFGGYSQTCTLSVSITSTGTAICSGTSVVLTATPSAGTAPYTYVWSTGEITPTISVNKAGTYSVTVSDNTPGCQAVKQSITLTSANIPIAPTANGATVCQNTPATLTATAPGGFYQWYDSQTGGNFLGSGAGYTTPPITAATTFYVETTIAGCTSPRTPVPVTIQANPTVVSAIICQGNRANLSASGASSYVWYDAPGGNQLATTPNYTTPVLFATTTYYVVATYANGCTSAPTPVGATIFPPPQAPTVASTSVCSGSVASLHAVAPSGAFEWFSVPNGGVPLITSPDYTTPPLIATTTYYVQTVAVGGCVSTRTPVTVTVNPIPTTPTIANTAVCSGSGTTLTPTAPGGSYDWYAQSGALLFTGPSFNTPVLTNTTTYYVSSLSAAGCTSARVPVTVTVNQQPAAPSVNPQVVCSGNPATLIAFAPAGATYEWYDAAVGGNLLFTGASYTTPALIATTVYYVQATIAGCTGARAPVTVTVSPIPVGPTASGPPSVCSGSVATLTASGGSAGTTYDWYDALTGGNYLSSGQVYVTPALLATTTFYVQGTNGGCPSARTAVTVVVNAIPSPPTTSVGPAVCPGTPSSVTANAASGTIQWYTAANGGTLLGSGNTLPIAALLSNTTYYAQNTVGSCVSARTPITATVIAVANPQFQYPSGTFCTSGANPTPAIYNPSGGTFSASPAGLVFISATTGQINVATSTPGNYTISFAGNGACPATATVTIAIVTTPNAQFSYSGPFCTNQANPLPVFPAGASGGTFTASSGSLVFRNTITGEISLASSTPGTYTVTNTIAASGACPLTVFSATVTIDPVVIVNAGPNQTISSGTTAQLAGSVTNAASETWSGGTGSFSNTHILNPVYTPGPGETSATLTLTSSDPPGPCGPISAQVTITINPVPGSPTASGLAICSGSTATLSATAPGGAYQWYDALTGGTLLQSGPSYTTPLLIVNTTYYVQTTIGGIASARTPVTVTVNAIPAAPVVAAVPPICSGSTATLTASGSSGNYTWYDSLVGGSLLFAGSTFVTPVLNANTSYYVESSANTCSGSRTKVDVTVNPIPAITSSPSGTTCSGTALSYTITSDIPTATFTWSRAAVAGISNPALINQASANINEALINTGGTPVNVTYVIVPTASGCPGTPFNYVVTVNPIPVVTSTPPGPICNGTSSNYTITFNTPSTNFTWSRPAVAGISNTPVTGQTAGTIQELLNNTTTAPVDVTYIFNYTAGSCAGAPYNLVVTVDPTATVTSQPTGTICGGVAQNYVITSNLPTATFSWDRAAVAGISNPAVANQTSGTITETLNNTSTIPVKVYYLITPLVNGCPGTTFVYTVTVSPQPPTPIANGNSPICIGSTIQLRAPTVTNATYLWTGPNGYSSPLQNSDITNATLAESGVYNLTVTVNGGCPSNPSPVTIIVDEPPLAVAGPPQTVCNNVTSVTLAGTMSGGTKTGIWSGGTGKFLPGPDQLDAQYIPSAADKAAGSVTLTLTSTSKDDCTISTSPMTITFLTPIITSSPTGAICTGNAQNYIITSSTPTATFSWSRAAVPGISNPAVTGQTTGIINETLINTGTTAINVTYVIVAIDNGCPGTPFNYVVTVNPTPVAPSASVANTHVCVNSDIQLQTPAIANATYAWTGPNSFTSASQNPDIPNVTAAYTGTYSLVVSVNGCPSPPATVSVVVDVPPVAVAGPNQIVCATTTSITVAGTVDNGAGTGVWSTSGTGKFTAPNQLNTQYQPSAADIAAGTVTLFLTPTSKPDCVLPAPSGLTISFKPAPAADAGPDQDVCSQATTVILAGKILVAGEGNWTTSGTGTFNPASAPVNSVYLPSADDIKNGSVTLTLRATGASECAIATSDVVIKFTPPPTVNAGGTKYLLRGRTITLDPTVSDSNVQYLWTPNTGIDNNTIKDPTITGIANITYTLTVTDSRGCVASDQVIINVLPALTIPNTFTPNGDGINDLWDIKGLAEYQQSTVDIFDRYGQKVFHSVGYGKAWDGTYGGKQVPVGTYYYIIDTKTFGQVLSGPITLIR